jgi:ADP-ribosyl-[dinitrogen reductase] hydrolase
MNKDQIMGGIIGVVVGDALGLPVQFEDREMRQQRLVTGMEGWGALTYHQVTGQMTLR